MTSDGSGPYCGPYYGRLSSETAVTTNPTAAKRKPPAPDEHTARLLRAQDGYGPAHGELPLRTDHEPDSPAEWEQWFVTVRRVAQAADHRAARRPAPDVLPASTRPLPAAASRRAQTTSNKRLGQSQRAAQHLTQYALPRGT
jgi:hypothetical protein